MSIAENKETALKFKMPFLPVMWLIFVGNLLGFILLFPFLMGQRMNLTVSLQHICVVIWFITLIVDIALTFACIAYFKVKLNARGISCFNFWGIYSFVLWEEMREAKIINFLGLKIVRVFFRKSRIPFWVPLFIKNSDCFSKALSEFAPQSNLLRQVFEQNK